MKKRFLFLFLLFGFIINIASCNSTDKAYPFKYAITGNPKTLDPQCALNDNSDAVIHTVFQGLFTFGENGEIENGMIDSFHISEDGTIWTFNIKPGIYWSDGDEFSAECTAEDFVFGFQRLFRPATKSECAADYFIIKNSEAVNSGAVSDISLLGVRAIDKYTLEIVLNEPCSDFMSLLALPPAMPCNQEFFESTQGRYGLAADCVASNNGYYVHTWNYDKWSDEGNYIILRRNTLNQYSADSPYTINLFIDPVNERKDFDEEILNVYKGKDYKEITELHRTYKSDEYETAVWGLIFNTKGNFSSHNYRLELSAATEFTASDERYKAFNGIIPYSVITGQGSYRDIVGDLNSVISSAKGVGTLSGMRMIMPSGTGLRTDIGKILQKWQSECGFYCSISELDSSEYTSALENGDFDIALVKLTGEYNSPYAYLNDFLTGNSANYGNYENQKYSHIINSALSSNDSTASSVYYKEAEQLLIDSGIFVPLCIETEYVFYKEKLETICYNPFSGVYSIKG